MSDAKKGWSAPIFVGLFIVALSAFAWLLSRAQALPDGPEPVAWDLAACAHCRMHVGEPRFAAQLQTQDGQVLYFDDPGCLLRYEAEREPDVHAIWFRHFEEERWVPKDAVAFVQTSPTPMGYDIAAVERGAQGALSYADALSRVMSREAGAMGAAR